MKYIDADKLLANLRRQKHELELSIQSQGDFGQSCHIIAYESILSFITSLQQEHSEVDLEKEIEKWFDVFGEAWENGEWSTNDIRSTARHFYELGLKARKEE